MNPDDFLHETESMLAKMNAMRNKHVAVGILSGGASSQVYGDGMTALKVGVIHELGLGRSPQRSFLRMPQELKKAPLKAYINLQLEKVLAGDPVAVGLGKIGIYATNLSVDAFDTEGFGKWPALSAMTILNKGSSKILTDTGILKNSITYEVR